MLAAALLTAALSGPAAVAGAAAHQAASGQTQPAAAGQPAPRQPGASRTDGKLPVSLDRIRRQLQRATTEHERFENFRLITSLNVYGQAPPFEVFAPTDSASSVTAPGPIRYGGMTHSEFLSQVTPKNFQAPVMNLSGGLFSLANWASEKKKKEAERRKAAEARRQAEIRRQEQSR